MKANNYIDIPAEKFSFVQQDAKIYDEKFTTKPIGYFKDAWIRFRKGIGSVIAACVLIIIVLFAVFAPMFAKYDMDFSEMFFANVTPKNPWFEGTGFWDGTKKVENMDEKQYKYYQEFIPETGYILETLGSYEDSKGKVKYDVIIDTYKQQGFVYKLLDAEQLTKLERYQAETGIQIMYPLLSNFLDSNDANNGGRNNAKMSYYKENNEIMYKVDRSGVGTQWQVRVLFYEYFVYETGSEPNFLFGINSHGQDIFIRLAMGARLSLLLGLAVAVINVTIGLIYGAIEGYYGGTVDLLMERFVEILAGLPFVVLVTLYQLHLAQRLGVILTLLFAYVSTGWIGTAGTVRQQFYRYKNREYVLAARTLGAKDRRLIFRHILPNAIGPLITSTVLVIPGVIFGESMLSFLGIIDLSTSGMTSIGAMLNDGQDYMRQFPHIIMFPAIFISILMISFNVFGNGLRDAFNPSLRGVEE